MKRCAIDEQAENITFQGNQLLLHYHKIFWLGSNMILLQCMYHIIFSERGLNLSSPLKIIVA